jgi:hypothetical protein
MHLKAENLPKPVQIFPIKKKLCFETGLCNKYLFNCFYFLNSCLISGSTKRENANAIFSKITVFRLFFRLNFRTRLLAIEKGS